MAKRKWYVVTVGKSVGVYPTWVETAPLVKGVSEAIYQGFSSEAEARRVFLQEMSKGTTRVVGSGNRPSGQNSGQTTPRQTYSEPNIGRGTYHEFERPPMTPNPRRNEANVSPLRREKTEPDISISEQQYPASRQLSSPVGRSPSQSQSSKRRFEIIDALFKKEPDSPGVEAWASRSPAASSPTKSMASFGSPRTGVTQPPEVIVKTPSWLSSYPKARQTEPKPLSPLSRDDLPLHSFSALSLTPSAEPSSPVTSPRSSSGSSAGDTSMYISPRSPPEQVTLVDPRSPIRSKSQVPELAYVSPLLLFRPSPSSKNTPLVPQVEDPTSIPPASLLFKPSPKTPLINSKA